MRRSPYALVVTAEVRDLQCAEAWMGLCQLSHKISGYGFRTVRRGGNPEGNHEERDDEKKAVHGAPLTFCMRLACNRARADLLVHLLNPSAVECEDEGRSSCRVMDATSRPIQS